ncbi:ASCH domain-containing protein [Pararhizobium gei]|uniref:ASCH domain-containing protein n=1 Tax=Pararhizobium gei TaxID=1395951 RepID=UPI0023D99836|nr:ASCH domain-containing protein [Rhizobium gei]
MTELLVRKGLVIDQPWISMILAGQKDWEMRSSSTSHRGWFGLIWKGMGSIYGVARLVDVGSKLEPDAMVAAFEHHQIPEELIRSGGVAKWNTPWKLAEVIRLPKPVRYRHPSGAVTWVNLDDKVTSSIEDQLLALRAGPQELEDRPNSIEASSEIPRVTWKKIGETFLTQGNLDNSHIYLRDFFDRFPVDAVGGSNKALRSTRDIQVSWNGGPIITTDLDGSKKFFRARSWIRDFFAHHAADPGDKIVVEEGHPYEYRICFEKAL